MTTDSPSDATDNNPAPPPTDRDVIAYANECLQVEGEVEIDDDATELPKGRVSRNPDNECEGAYVLAWVWVPDEAVREWLETQPNPKP